MAGGAPGPGRGKAPAVAAGGKIIHKVADLTEEEDAKVREQLEVGAGLRCGGCGERVTHGFEFCVIETKRVDGKAVGQYTWYTACSGRKDCDYAGAIGPHAVAMREVRQRFLDTPEMRQLLERVLSGKAKETSGG